MFKLNFFKSYKFSNSREKKRTTFFNIFTGLLFLFLISYLIYIPQKKTIKDPKLKIGDIVEKDIIIERDLTIEDKESTEQKRKQAIENIVPIYEYNAENQTKSRQLINDWFRSINELKKEYLKKKNDLKKIKNTIEEKFGIDRSESDIRLILKSNVFNQLDLNKLLQFIKKTYDKRILSSKIGTKTGKEDTIKITLKDREPVTLNVKDVYDLKEVKTELIKFIKSQKLTQREIDILSSILMEFVDVNISYSISLTKEEEKRISSQIDPVLIKLKSGKVILRKGDEIKPEDMKIIRLIATEEKIREKKLPDFYLIFAFLLFLFIFIERFFKIWENSGLNKNKLFIVTIVNLTSAAIIYRISLFLLPLILRNITFIEINYDTTSIYFAIPFGFAALIMAFNFNLQSAVVFSFINAIIGGIICGWDLRIFLYILISNFAVSYGIEYYQRLKRSPIFKASIFWLLPVNVITILLFKLTEYHVDFMNILLYVCMGIFSAILSPVLANFISPLWEAAFKLITDLKLIEINNLNLPIFREMLEKAPGTYHHSQMVASLSEAAGLELGLSPLLLTSMSLYHDIGKIDNPQFFTENQTLYPDPHENLTPRESSKNIIAHITNGLERADKIKLPAIVKSAINQHHGTKLVKFFYDKAREMSTVETDEFDDKSFRYQGEKPKDIENAIIMLADQVEAASKSLESPTEEEIRNVIQQIISTNIEENQFDECDRLTFKSLNIIANSFHKKLSSIYHMRVSYPGFDFKDNNDKNNR